MKRNMIMAILVTIILVSIIGCSKTQTAKENIETRIDTKTEETAKVEIKDQLIYSERDSVVSNVKELKKALKHRQDNRTIILKPGIYTDLGRVTMTSSNLIIKAETPRTVTFNGKVQFEIKGASNLLTGIDFIGGEPFSNKGVVVIRGSNNRLENSLIKDFNNYEYVPNKEGEYLATRWVTISGKNNSIINNTFDGKYKRGTMVVVEGTEENDRSLIKRNVFKNLEARDLMEIEDDSPMKRTNENERQAIRIGSSKTSQTTSKAAIVENFFTNIDGEIEMIAIKACDVIIKGNTIRNSGSMISLRQGKRNIVENNVIFGDESKDSGGIRFYDEDHRIKNNYIEGTKSVGGDRAAISINTGITNPEIDEKLDPTIKGMELNRQWTPKNILIQNNTLVNNRRGVLFSEKVHKTSLVDDTKVEKVYAAANLRVKNNLIIGNTQDLIPVELASKEMMPSNTLYVNNVIEGLSKRLSTGNKGIETTLPEIEKIDGLLTAKKETLGAKGLIVLTEQTTGIKK